MVQGTHCCAFSTSCCCSSRQMVQHSNTPDDTYGANCSEVSYLLPKEKQVLHFFMLSVSCSHPGAPSYEYRCSFAFDFSCVCSHFRGLFVRMRYSNRRPRRFSGQPRNILKTYEITAEVVSSNPGALRFLSDTKPMYCCRS